MRKLESYRQKGDLLQGVKLPGGGILRIEKNFVQVELPQDIPDDKPDNIILKVCKGLAETEKEGQVILVTKDIVLRLKAQILGIRAEDFERERISEDDAQYTGRTEIYFPEEKVKEFKKKGTLNVPWFLLLRSRFCFWLSLSLCFSVFLCLKKYRENWTQ